MLFILMEACIIRQEQARMNMQKKILWQILQL